MSALPEDGHDAEDWDDEWNRDEWQALNVIDRERMQGSWMEWGARLLAIALVLPVVLGILALLLILAF